MPGRLYYLDLASKAKMPNPINHAIGMPRAQLITNGKPNKSLTDRIVTPVNMMKPMPMMSEAISMN